MPPLRVCFYTLDQRGEPVCETGARLFSAEILEKCSQLLGLHCIILFCVEKDIYCSVVHQKVLVLVGAVSECVHRKSFSERVSQTQKNNVALIKHVIAGSVLHIVNVHQPLVIPRPLCQGSAARGLNLYVERASVSVLDIDIESYSARNEVGFHSFFCGRLFDSVDFYVEENLNEMPADFRIVLKDFAEDEVVCECEPLPFLSRREFVSLHFSFLFLLKFSMITIYCRKNAKTARF